MGSGNPRRLRADRRGAVHGVEDPATLPSARVLDAIRQRHDGSYCGFALAQTALHRNALLGAPLPADAEARLAAMAVASLAEQRAIEARDEIPFEQFRRQYLDPASLRA